MNGKSVKTILVLLNFFTVVLFANGTKFINTNGYTNCVEISNGTTRVVLEPNCGGRVLYYELNGKNVIYVDPKQDGWVWDGNPKGPFPRFGVTGGRFDIGPEKIMAKRPLLFHGKWDAKITGKYSARLISQKDSSSGFQLVRDFELDPKSSCLKYTQTIINVSNEEKKVYHWSRTFIKGGGISLTPIAKYRRYPKGYLVYGPPDNVIQWDPTPDSSLRVRDNVMEIIGEPMRPKIAIDTDGEWTAYITTDNQLFMKIYKVYPEKSYGDMAANPISIWYNKLEMTEIEPTSPSVILKPGKKNSFTEHWFLMDYDYPKDRKANLTEIKKMAEGCSKKSSK